MSENKDVGNLEERIRTLENQLEVLAQQLQRTQRALFLAKFMADNPGATLTGLAKKHLPLPVPTGFLVTFSDGPDVGKQSIILGAPHANGRVH